MLVAMTVSGLTAVAMERIAYRPLRRRNAPRLAALITAIGISLFLQELFAVRYGRDRSSASPGCWRSGSWPRIGGANIRTDKVLVRGGRRRADGRPRALRGQVPAGPGHPGHRPGPGDGGPDGRQHRPGRRCSRSCSAGCWPAPRARSSASSSRRPATTSASCPGIKAFTAAVLGGIGNIRGALVGRPAARAAGELGRHRARRRVEGRVRLHRARARADVPAHRPARRGLGRARA